MRIRTYYIFLFLTNLIFAQQPVTIQLTEKDGLPDIEFYDILEDHNGFIWFAADKGLYRYDGKSFLNFTNPNKRGLSVFGLFEDDKGRLWCNNISGQFFYVDNDKLQIFTDLKDDLNGQLPEFVVQNNHLIAFSEKGVFKINLNTKKKHIVSDTSIKSPYYGSPFCYNDKLYFNLANKIMTFESANLKINSVYTVSEKIIPQKNGFCKLNEDLFCFSYSEGKQHFFIQGKNKKSFVKLIVPKELKDKTIQRVVQKDDLIWFCTNQGIIVCTWNGNSLSYKNTYLLTEFITKIIKDQNNNYWFTSLRNGVFVMPNIYIKKVSLPENTVQITNMCVTNDDNLTYGTPDGKIGTLNTTDFHGNQFSLLTNTKVSQLVYNKQYKTLFISQESQSYFWNLNLGTITNLPFFQASKATTIANANSLLNASYDRASVLQNPFAAFKSNPKNEGYKKPVFIDSKTTSNIKDIRLKRAYTCLYSSKNNSNYIGFVDELIQFDSNLKETIIRYKNQPIFAIDLTETQDHIIWVSTFKDGILGIKDTKVVYNFTTQNGLLSNQTGKLKSDRNTLWITTEQGLQLLDIKSKTFKNITKNDGLDTYSVSDIEILGNKVFLSSNKGIYLLEKNKCFKNYTTPKIYFTNVNIQEKDTVLRNNYKLDFDKNAIKISFNANGFQTSESIVYQYRLLGLNDKWLTLEKGINFVRYSSLPSGNFVFEVKAMNKNGMFSAKKSMQITIEAPFWQKWWFYVLGSLSIIFVAGYYFRMQIKRTEKEKQIAIEKAEIDKELIFSQLENLRSQMNPHFIFNALNSIQEYIITNEKQTASAFLVKFSRLIRIYLEHSRESEVQLNEELKALQLYLELEKDRFEDSLEYSLTIANEINTTQILIPSLFIQPYIENALKHGLLHKKDNRILSISFELNKEKDSLICTILDNGIGRVASTELNKKRAHLHKSFATSANEKRVELINKIRTKKASVFIADLYDENQKALGTKVVITMPFK